MVAKLKRQKGNWCPYYSCQSACIPFFLATITYFPEDGFRDWGSWSLSKVPVLNYLNLTIAITLHLSSDLNLINLSILVICGFTFLFIFFCSLESVTISFFYKTPFSISITIFVNHFVFLPLHISKLDKIKTTQYMFSKSRCPILTKKTSCKNIYLLSAANVVEHIYNV